MCFRARSPGGLCGWEEDRGDEFKFRSRKQNRRTFKASPSEAAPASPILLFQKLMDVTDLFVCSMEEIRKVFLGQVTGGLCGSMAVARGWTCKKRGKPKGHW